MSYSGAVRHSVSPMNDDGWKFAPLTVTDCPCTRSVCGVTVIDEGAGSGALSSKSSGLFATRVTGPYELLTSEHRPGASAQSTSPLARCSTRRTVMVRVNVPVPLVAAKSEPWVQSPYDVASLVHCTICTPLSGLKPVPDTVTLWKLRRSVSGVTVVCTAGSGPLGSKPRKTWASKS